MLKEQCQVGMVVEFGKENGEWTKAEVIKINNKMAKVRTLETRGNGRGSQAGTVWSVAYSLMRPINSDALPVVPNATNPADEPVAYNRFAPYHDICIMEAIVDCYNRLSPEWLTADGERPAYQVHALRGNLNNKLSYLFKALGRSVSESVAHKWFEEKRSYENKKVI
jgi:hypothetical protein